MNFTHGPSKGGQNVDLKPGPRPPAPQGSVGSANLTRLRREYHQAKRDEKAASDKAETLYRYLKFEWENVNGRPAETADDFQELLCG